MGPQNESADRDSLTPVRSLVWMRSVLTRSLQLCRLPSLSIQPSERTRSKKATPVDNTQTHISRAKDWRRDAEASGPCSLDVLILRLQEGDNFKVFQHGGKCKKKSVAARMASTWMMANGCPTYRDEDSILANVCTIPSTLQLSADQLALYALGSCPTS